jgi:esterase
MAEISEHEVGSVRSGDVDIFFRRFGRGSTGTPVLILHGANYYDSRDWLSIAAELGHDREVVAFDARGYGESTWSATKDYSLDAQLSDIGALLGHLGWQRTALVGHSRGGSFALRFAREFPSLVAALVLVDFSPGHRPGRSATEPLTVGVHGPVYATLEAAVAATSRDQSALQRPDGRARIESLFTKRDGGWVNVKRDPDFHNERPVDRPGWVSAYPPLELWNALSDLRVPRLVIRGTRSGVYDEPALRRLREELPAVEVGEVASGHDVAGTAPDELSAALRAFLAKVQ